MSESGYRRVKNGATKCNNGFKGFRVNIRKLSIQKLRVRFLHFFKVLFKWRKSYENAVKSFKKGFSGVGFRRNNSYNFSSQSNFVTNQSKRRLISDPNRRPDCKLRSLGRTNSFYTEAIADCLEFIKRNSLSVDDHQNNEAVALR